MLCRNWGSPEVRIDGGPVDGVATGQKEGIEANQPPAVLSTDYRSAGYPRVIAYRLHATFLLASVLAFTRFAMATDEAMEDVRTGGKRPSVDIENLKRKKFKAEDLPLSAAQHAAIDKLLHSFRKKGGFDSIRKTIWAEFNDGVRIPSSMLL